MKTSVRRFNNKRVTFIGIRGGHDKILYILGLNRQYLKMIY